MNPDQEYLDLALDPDMFLEQKPDDPITDQSTDPNVDEAPFPILLQPSNILAIGNGHPPPRSADLAAPFSIDTQLVHPIQPEPRTASKYPDSIQKHLDTIDQDGTTWKCPCSFAKLGTAHGVTWSRLLQEHQGELAQLYERFPELDSSNVRSRELKRILTCMLNLSNPDELEIVGPFPRKEEIGFHAYLELIPKHYVSYYSYRHHVCLIGVLLHGILALMDIRSSFPDWVRTNIADFDFCPPPQCPPDNLDFLIQGDSPTLEFKFTCVNLMDRYRSTLRQLEPYSIDLKKMSDGINDIGVSKTLALLGVPQPYLKYNRPTSPVPSLWEVHATTSHVHCIGHGFRAADARHAALIHLLVLVIRGVEPSAFNDLAAGRATTALIQHVDETLGEILMKRRSRDKNIEMDGFSVITPPSIQSKGQPNGSAEDSPCGSPINLGEITTHRIHNQVALSAEPRNDDRMSYPRAESPDEMNRARSRSRYHAGAGRVAAPAGMQTPKYDRRSEFGFYDDELPISYSAGNTGARSETAGHVTRRFDDMEGITTASLRSNRPNSVGDQVRIADEPENISTASLRQNSHPSRRGRAGIDEGISALRQLSSSGFADHAGRASEFEDGICPSGLGSNGQTGTRPARARFDDMEGMRRTGIWHANHPNFAGHSRYVEELDSMSSGSTRPSHASTYVDPTGSRSVRSSFASESDSMSSMRRPPSQYADQQAVSRPARPAPGSDRMGPVRHEAGYSYFPSNGDEMMQGRYHAHAMVPQGETNLHRGRPRPIELMALSNRRDRYSEYDDSAVTGYGTDTAILDLQTDINNLRSFVNRQKSMFMQREEMYLRNQMSLQAQIDYNDAAIQRIVAYSAGNPRLMPDVIAPVDRDSGRYIGDGRASSYSVARPRVDSSNMNGHHFDSMYPRR